MTPSLDELLTTLQRAESGLVEFAPDIITDLKDKVDSYKYIDLKYESEINRIEAQVEELNNVKQALKSNKDKLRQLMTFHMKDKGFTKLPGELYQVSLVTQKDVDLFPMEASAENYSKYPNLMEMKFSWRVKAVKDLVLGDPEANRQFGMVREKSHVKFTARKVLK